MIYLQASELTKSYGDRLLFGDVNLTLSEGDKVGLIARNGTGKSTLLKILAGLEDYDSGNIVYSRGLRIGYLGQEPEFDPTQSILANVTPPAVGEDDWTAEDRAREMLHKFDIDDFTQKPGSMSGGQLKRAAIAGVLLKEPDLLILDEPTNHLDIATVEKLEQMLSTTRSTLLMVTHDRYFLDRVCSRIIEIDRENLYSYDGDYSYYLEKRQERLDALDAELAKVKNLLRTEQEWMRRQPQARGSKAKYRIDQFYNLKERSRVNLNDNRVNASDVEGSYIGKKIFEACHVSKSFGDKVILRDWSYDFARYDKVGIVGENGVGKSTFIKMLLGEVTPDSGIINVGQTVKWGYYSQEGMVDFDDRKRVIDAVREIAEVVKIDDKTTLTASQFLNRFLFSVPEQQKYIAKLSGGERRRLNLAVTLMKSPNFLVFDEPTNDLDIVTLSVLEDYLASFKGCVIVVSHDRFFLDRIAGHLFVFKGDGEVIDFPGNYSQYREYERMHVRESQPADRRNDTQSRRTPRESKGLTFKERKEKEALETKVAQLEKEKLTLEAAMSTGAMQGEELQHAAERIRDVLNELDEGEMRLLELMEKESM